MWTAETSSDGDGAIRLRISQCPAGFALVRKQIIPQSDACIECPGTSYHAYSLAPAVWNENADETNLDDFCLKCPTPPSSVKCWGGTNGKHSVSDSSLTAPHPSLRASLVSLFLSPCVNNIRTYTHDQETGVCILTHGAYEFMSTYVHSNRTRELVARGGGGSARGRGGS